MLVDDAASGDGGAHGPVDYVMIAWSWWFGGGPVVIGPVEMMMIRCPWWCLICLMMEHLHLMMTWWCYDMMIALVTWYIHSGDGLMSFGHDDIHDVTWCSCLWWGTLFPFFHSPHLPCASPIYPCKPLQKPSHTLPCSLHYPLNPSYILALHLSSS